MKALNRRAADDTDVHVRTNEVTTSATRAGGPVDANERSRSFAGRIGCVHVGKLKVAALLLFLSARYKVL